MQSITTHEAVVESPSRGRAANIALWAGQILLAAAFAFGGINKLFGLQPEMVQNFDKLAGPWFRHLVGTFELAGAIALVVPRLSGVGAVWLGGVMTGAVITHLTVQPPAYFATIPAVLGIVFALIARAHWGQTKLLLGLPRARRVEARL
jgi:putative oxidoreductase